MDRNLGIGAALFGLCLGAAGCADDDADSGALAVLVNAEDVIVEGLEPGDDLENIRDGWAVGFDKYVVVLGHVHLRLATDADVEIEAEESVALDLTQVPASGLPLLDLDGLEAGRYELFYETPGAGHGATRDKSVSTSDFDAMVDNDWTYLISGTLMKQGGQSCPPEALATPGDAEPNGNTSGDDPCYDAETVRFEFGAEAETVFGPCEIDGVPGVAVVGGTTRTATVTIHGDHLFFNGFPEGAESAITRRAQWLADCDLDLDGTVTREELEAIPLSQLTELDPERYQLGAAPIAIKSAYDYVRAQLKTQGHFEGEGECPFDGMEHDHDHDH